MTLNSRLRFCLPLWAGLCLALAWPAALRAQACEARTSAGEASSAEIHDYLRGRGLTLLTFVGYSGAGYEDEAAMRAQAAQVLRQHDPRTTMVNIGATAAGIGAVYPIAKAQGFATLGIVSSLAREGGDSLSPCVDVVFFVQDSSWGGRLPNANSLAPTSAAIVANSQAIVGIGGGEIARDEMLAARAAGKPVNFISADMNHRIARDKASAKGQPEPGDFRGAAHAALADKP